MVGYKLGSKRHHPLQFFLESAKTREFAADPASRSAASRAAAPSSTPRISMASYTSVKVKARTTKPPVGNDFEQTFVRQTIQGQPDGGPRNAQPRDQGKLRQALSGLKIAAQKHLAKVQDGAPGLGWRNPTRCWLLWAQCTESYHSAKISGDGFPGTPRNAASFSVFSRPARWRPPWETMPGRSRASPAVSPRGRRPERERFRGSHPRHAAARASGLPDERRG